MRSEPELPLSRKMPNLYELGGTTDRIDQPFKKPFRDGKKRALALGISLLLHVLFLLWIRYPHSPVKIIAPKNYLVPVQMDLAQPITQGNASQTGAPEHLLTQPLPEPTPEISHPTPEPAPQIEHTKPTLSPPKISASSSGGLPGDQETPTTLHSIAPIYPKEALNRNWSGTVVVEVAVSSEGRPTAIQVLKSSGHTVLDDAFIRTIKLYYTFKPKTFLGNNIPGTLQLSYTFTLEP